MGWAKGRWYENYKNLKHNATNNEQLEEKKNSRNNNHDNKERLLNTELDDFRRNWR